MSGSIGAASYLPSLFAGLGAGDSLLSSLYGQTGSAAGTANPIAALRQATSQETRQVALTTARPEVKRDIDRFTAALAAAKTPRDLLDNPTALKVLLTANGLGNQVASTALARKALLSDPSQTNALVNRLADTRWKTTAQTYNFATKGLAALRDPKALAAITNGYAEVLWRQTLNQTTPGLSYALDFQSRASKITSVDQVLSDPTFREVVTTALNIPKQIAFQSLPAQENAVSTRIDLTKFQDPKFVARFTQRYLIQAAQNAAPAGGGTDLTTLAAQSSGLVV